jgi:hypothetical protein
MRLPATLIAIALLASLTGPAAAAQEQTPGFGAEVRLGPYGPRIGNESERASYEAHFGDSQPLLKALEVERYVWDEIGLLGIYARVGHWKTAGNTLRCEDDAGDTVACTPDNIDTATEGNDRTTLMVVPLSLGTVYRFDLLKRKWRVPLVVYGKVGLDYYVWRSTGGGEVSEALVVSEDGTVQQRTGSGGTAGFHAAGGLQLNLDWIESRHPSTRSFLSSYLFAEIAWRWADGFGDRDRLDMSDNQFLMGLAFDFR